MTTEQRRVVDPNELHDLIRCRVGRTAANRVCPEVAEPATPAEPIEQAKAWLESSREGADACTISELSDEIIRNLLAVVERLRQGERAADAEIAALQRWKDEQLAVESSWNVQAVGNELGLPLGTHIRAAILPAIKQLKADNAGKETKRDQTS